jgi:hypothetical protein
MKTIVTIWIVASTLVMLTGCEGSQVMSERIGVVTFKGGPLTLVGTPAVLGTAAGLYGRWRMICRRQRYRQ